MQITCTETEVTATGVVLNEDGLADDKDDALVNAFVALGPGTFTVILRKEVVV